MNLRCVSRRLALAAALFLIFSPASLLHAQDDDSSLSQKEIEEVREASYIPNEKIMVYVKILNTREQEIQDLLSKPHRPGFSQDMHDFLDQFAAIADEFNDNLDEYQTKHRDIRKSLPKLVSAIERWNTALRAPASDENYDVVRKMALDSLKDMHDAATSMQTEQAAYFKAHPDAAKMEKERASDMHNPVRQ